MKKTLVLLAWVLACAGAMGQSEQTSAEELQRSYRETVHKRDFSKHHRESRFPLKSKAIATKGSAEKSLPEDRVWFPGEWEEVKAICVTPFYSYQVPGHEEDNTWRAVPLVSGYADYLQYTRYGWQQRGMGPYSSTMDTTTSFGRVFFYVMDGIQLGGAEAWVRVENAADTAKVLRTLMRLNLRHERVRFIIGPGNSFWYRDCGPIAFYYGDQDSIGMLDFTYYPDRALDDSLPSLIHWQMGIPNYQTSIEWEGGNCLVDGAGMVLTSDAIYSSNEDGYGPLAWDGVDPNSIGFTASTPLSKSQVREALHDLLGQRATYVLPAYHYDGGTGHVDLYADAWDENGFVFTKMPSHYSSWTDYRIGQKNIDSLCSYKSVFNRDYYTMGELPFPSTDNGGNFSSQMEYGQQYTRTYSNHTFVNNVILQPCFSRVENGEPSAQWDRDNMEAIHQAYPGYTIYPIDVREFDGSGGAIHCVTKQIPADNPIRILHKNLHGIYRTGGGVASLPVSAVITNRSGIAHAEFNWRMPFGPDTTWHTIDLAANGNRFYGALPLLADTSVNLEYYISATSNNGKTITKPMTANQGGYYFFCYDNEVDTDVVFDSSFFDYDTLPMPAEDITFTFSTTWTTPDSDPARPLGIETVEMEEMFGQFHPNPATDEANLTIDLGDGQTYTVSIIDQSGRTIHTSSLMAAGHIEYTINAGKLASGVYNVVFSNKDARVVRRLIVK